MKCCCLAHRHSADLGARLETNTFCICGFIMFSHQLNMTLIAPVLPAAAAVSNPVTMSFSEKPKRCVIRGSQSILPSSRRSRHVGYCIQHGFFQSGLHAAAILHTRQVQTANKTHEYPAMQGKNSQARVTIPAGLQVRNTNALIDISMLTCI